MVLDDSSLPELTMLADTDPVINAVVSARVHAADTLVPARLGGLMPGARQGRLYARLGMRQVATPATVLL